MSKLFYNKTKRGHLASSRLEKILAAHDYIAFRWYASDDTGKGVPWGEDWVTVKTLYSKTEGNFLLLHQQLSPFNRRLVGRFKTGKELFRAIKLLVPHLGKMEDYIS